MRRVYHFLLLLQSSTQAGTARTKALDIRVSELHVLSLPVRFPWFARAIPLRITSNSCASPLYALYPTCEGAVRNDLCLAATSPSLEASELREHVIFSSPKKERTWL